MKAKYYNLYIYWYTRHTNTDLKVTSVAQRNKSQIPFDLSDLYVAYLESCNGTQLSWNQDKLIN